METTNKHVHIRAFAAWISAHRYGFIQAVCLFFLTLSLTWMLFYGEPRNPFDRGFWTRMEGYAVAIMIPGFSLALFFSDENSKFRAFIFSVFWGYLLALIWCAYWGIPYAYPIAAAALITIFYKNIRPDDYRTSNKKIATVIISIWFLSAFASGVFLSHIGYSNFLKKQEYTKQAINIPTIKAVDCKDCYIYTEEYGLEKMYNCPDIPEGSMIHRLPVEDGKVFVVAE